MIKGKPNYQSLLIKKPHLKALFRTLFVYNFNYFKPSIKRPDQVELPQNYCHTIFLSKIVNAIKSYIHPSVIINEGPH